jgi:RNA polymerase sigma-70 factor (ECF subfamily)
MAINHAQSASDPADEELILKVAKGDKDAYRILADRYVDMLFALARRMSQSETQAEDIVQEALLRLWEKAALWRPEGGASVKTWAYRVTYNLIIDVLRKNKREAIVDFPQERLQDMSDNSEKKLQKEQVGEIVKNEINSLPARQKEAIVLTYYECLSNAETAEIMDTTVKGVEALLVRARKQLNLKLNQFEGVF